jgi:hypothetical protein
VVPTATATPSVTPTPSNTPPAPKSTLLLPIAGRNGA